MSDNPQYGSQDVFALPRIRSLRLSGRDAVAFAQAQFMNDVAALAPGSFQWNGWLNPKGRIQALFALVRLDEDALCLLGHFDAGALRQALARFVFRSRVAIDVLVDWSATGVFAPPASARGASVHLDEVGALELDLSAAGGARTLRLGPSGSAPADPAREAAWHAFDLAHGWPSIPGADVTAWTPQQLSLERVAAFSVRKGCYPGQEIVARTHFLGRAKRGLALLEAADAAVGEPVAIDGGDAGTVLATADGLAAAVLPTDRSEGASLTVGGRPARERAIAPGLAR